MDDRLKKTAAAFENLCARREYCSHDIMQKLLRKLEGNEDGAREILAHLTENSYVSDLRYASAYAREKASIGGWGPAKISYALAAKRIHRSVIEEALKEIETDKASARMERMLEVKWRSLSEDPQGKLKLIRFALSRGYTYDQIKGPVDEITSGLE